MTTEAEEATEAGVTNGLALPKGTYRLEACGEVLILRLTFEDIERAEREMYDNIVTGITKGGFGAHDSAVLLFCATRTAGVKGAARFKSVREAGRWLVEGGALPQTVGAIVAVINSYYPGKSTDNGDPM